MVLAKWCSKEFRRSAVRESRLMVVDGLRGSIFGFPKKKEEKKKKTKNKKKGKGGKKTRTEKMQFTRARVFFLSTCF
jgi:hypothetical protein